MFYDRNLWKVELVNKTTLDGYFENGEIIRLDFKKFIEEEKIQKEIKDAFYKLFEEPERFVKPRFGLCCIAWDEWAGLSAWSWYECGEYVGKTTPNMRLVFRMRLCEIAGERGIHLRELSRRTGIAPSELSNMFNEGHNPTIETLAKLADALHVTPAQLIDTYEFKGKYVELTLPPY